MKQSTKDILKLMGKSVAGGAVIGLGSAVVFKGSVVGLAVAGVGGLAWGAHCAKKYNEKQALLAITEFVETAEKTGMTQKQILGFEETPSQSVIREALEKLQDQLTSVATKGRDVLEEAGVPVGELVTVQ